jgi:hypothetical protein
VEESRAVVVAAEQAVRVAVERARDVTTRLERLGSGRHLAHELEPLEAEIDSAWQELHEVERQLQQGASRQEREAPDEAERRVSPEIVDMQEEGQVARDNEPENTTRQDQQAQKADPDTRASQDVSPTISISASRIEQIERIDEEEEIVEMAAAMTSADIAAAKAAQAEAVAEDSSARVREVRRLVEQADTILEQVRLAIERGALQGDAADAALYDAENDATHVHTKLAEAEAVEERTRRAAMNAEAEAEIAEGMARATQGRFTHEEYRDAGEYVSEVSRSSYSHESLAAASDNKGQDDVSDVSEDKRDDEENTLEMPSATSRSRDNAHEQQH